MLRATIGDQTYSMFGDLETHFESFKKNVVGNHYFFETPYGKKKILYADWTASGRLYLPIEKKITHTFGPLVGNTHTESNITGTTMTRAYHLAGKIIKRHVNASNNDILIMDGSGMTSVVNKLQRLLGIRVPDNIKSCLMIKDHERPIIFVTHMEHHSNYISWLETIGDVVMIEPTREGSINFGHLEGLLKKYEKRSMKIGAFTACSNVTGIETPYYQLARMMHKYGGVCFIDFSASAPYVKIDMHPEDPLEKLDGIMFSPHKFLGGPGTPGVLVLDSSLIKNKTPDHPGGGTVLWTNPWGEFQYFSNIEEREDGGTPGFLQAIKTALCVLLKEKMEINKMIKRDKEMANLLLHELSQISSIHLLDGHIKDRLGIVSFYVEDIHHQLFVTLLNDRFGIQVRGGCSCAGPYGHYLLNIDKEKSKTITDYINHGDMSMKPGWVRISLHPIMSNEEIYQIVNGIKAVIRNGHEWKKEYYYDSRNDRYIHHSNYQLNINKLFRV